MRDPLSPGHASFNPDDVGFALYTDPLSDLLLSVAAIIVLAVIVLLPAARFSASEAGKLTDHTAITFQGQAVQPLFATPRGLQIGPGTADTIPVDRILDDQRLTVRLQHMRETGEALLLVIEPEGFEAAFLFEAVTSIYGPKRSWQIRLDTPCTDKSSAASGLLCAAYARSHEESK
jgi:hypothetical protein